MLSAAFLLLIPDPTQGIINAFAAPGRTNIRPRAFLVSTKNKTPVWETVAILVAIVSLWHPVFKHWADASESFTLEDLPLSGLMNWAHPAWDALMYVAFAVMLFVAVRRVGRVRRTSRHKDDNDAGPVNPYGPSFSERVEKK